MRADIFRLAGELDVLHPGEDLLELRLDNQLGRRGPDAMVLAMAECQVVVGSPGDVIAERVGKDGVISVGRRKPACHPFPFPDQLAADLCITQRSSHHVHDRARPTDELIACKVQE